MLGTELKRDALIFVLLLAVINAAACSGTLKGREQKLRKALYSMRLGIDRYANDRKHSPQSLGELVSAGYLPQIPIDPLTDSRDTWTEEREDRDHALDHQHPGIIDVHSGSGGTASDGTAYNTW